ncbi:uncharacterized protein LOC129586751 [Paramacrobiotus metropolitanus]|uniref:uncharacterized protein LOC129586751 n=1 Tax=Paramacrobiotus metropolitanus TaxID=2943436 RepID=UPI00244571F3|nr:uncharacterized protein LOC129586751 [Paramacrobiotus metropolitanus]XP_055336106.1 uncharacterized protein LOC129586751 [Paramacrobiotus metropolitanus]
MIPKDTERACTSVVVTSDNKLHSNPGGPFRSSWALSLEQVSAEKAQAFQNLLLQIAIGNAVLWFFGATLLITVGFEHVELALVGWVSLICCLTFVVRSRSQTTRQEILTVTRTHHILYTDVFALKLLAGMVITSAMLALATLSHRCDRCRRLTARSLLHTRSSSFPNFSSSSKSHSTKEMLTVEVAVPFKNSTVTIGVEGSYTLEQIRNMISAKIRAPVESIEIGGVTHYRNWTTTRLNKTQFAPGMVLIAFETPSGRHSPTHFSPAPVSPAPSASVSAPARVYQLVHPYRSPSHARSSAGSIPLARSLLPGARATSRAVSNAGSTGSRPSRPASVMEPPPAPAPSRSRSPAESVASRTRSARGASDANRSAPAAKPGKQLISLRNNTGSSRTPVTAQPGASAASAVGSARALDGDYPVDVIRTIVVENKRLPVVTFTDCLMDWPDINTEEVFFEESTAKLEDLVDLRREGTGYAKIAEDTEARKRAHQGTKFFQCPFCLQLQGTPGHPDNMVRHVFGTQGQFPCKDFCNGPFRSDYLLGRIALEALEVPFPYVYKDEDNNIIDRQFREWPESTADIVLRIRPEDEADAERARRDNNVVTDDEDESDDDGGADEMDPAAGADEADAEEKSDGGVGRSGGQGRGPRGGRRGPRGGRRGRGGRNAPRARPQRK